jgi:hypothetical protein
MSKNEQIFGTPDAPYRCAEISNDNQLSLHGIY